MNPAVWMLRVMLIVGGTVGIRVGDSAGPGPARRFSPADGLERPANPSGRCVDDPHLPAQLVLLVGAVGPLAPISVVAIEG